MGLLVRGQQVALVKSASPYWRETLGQPPGRKKGFEVIAQTNPEEVELRGEEGIQKIPVVVVTLVGGRPKKPLE